MSNQKPTITISDKASKTNIQEQLENIVNYAESIERDIALATTNNEVVQARGGYDTLTQRLAVPHSQLPVFDYEIVGTIGFNTTFNCFLTWKGRHWRDTVTVNIDTTEAFYKILCFDPDTEKFEEQLYTKVKLPLLMVKLQYTADHAIYNLATLFDSEGDPQEIGAYTTSDIEGKSLFAWIPAGGIKKDNTFLRSIFYCNERFVNCDIDFRAIHLQYQNKSYHESFKCENTIIRNLKAPVNVEHENRRAQFVIEGDNNIVHLLDNTKIDFQKADGSGNEHTNILSIPYDMEDNYYTTMANESADRISLDNPTRTAQVSGAQTEIGRYDFFTLFIGGKRYKRPKKIWTIESARATHSGAPHWRSVSIDDYPTADMLYFTIWVQASSGNPVARAYSAKWGLGILLEDENHYIIGLLENGAKSVRVVDRNIGSTTQTSNTHIMTSYTVSGIEI